MKNLDANIFGVSKEKYNSGFYFETGLDQMYEEEYLLDLSEEKQVHKLSTKVENKGIDIVFHFAAQAIVSQSFISPLETIKANTLGTYLISNLVNQLSEPKVLLLDECFAALDVMTIKMLQQIIVNLQSENRITICICDHQARDLLSCVDVAVVLSDGKVIAKGTPSELVKNPNAQSAYFGDSFKFN